MEENRVKKGLEITELIEPLKKFYRMNCNSEILFMWIVPILVMFISIVFSFIQVGKANSNVYEFLNDILGDFITIMTLFISFTMGYLSIILSSNSENIEELKRKDSIYYKDEKGEYYKLFQILITGITYSVIVEIFFLIVCITEKFIMVYTNCVIMKVLCSFNAGVFAHIVIVLLIIIKNMYYSFWKPE